MCFRPPDVTTGPLICPACGKKIVSPNFVPVACPFCKAPLPTDTANASMEAAKTVPGAPKAPGTPQPPNAPKA